MKHDTMLAAARPRRAGTGPRPRTVGSVLAVALVVGGCSASAAGEAERDASPLVEFLGWNVRSSPAEERAQQLRVEEAVAGCMRTQGFEYIPVDMALAYPEPNDDDAELAGDPRAYGERYGYGIVRGYELSEDPAVVAAPADAGRSNVDPNEQYVSTLSDTERDAYHRALFGAAEFAGDADPAASAPTAEELGCYGVAQLDVYGDRIVADPAVMSRVSDHLQSSGDDPDLRAAERDWLECLTSSSVDLAAVDGFRVDRPDAMFDYMTLRKAQAQGMTIAPLDPATGEPVGGVETENGWGLIERSDGSGWAFFGTSDGSIPDDALERLRRVELELWQADQSCQDEVGLPEIRRRIEQRLVDDLRAEFPELERS